MEQSQNQQLHPVQTNLVNWFNEAITIEELGTRINLIKHVVDTFVTEFNKRNPAPAQEPQPEFEEITE